MARYELKTVDTISGETMTYPSISQAAKILDVSGQQLTRYAALGKLVHDRLQVTLVTREIKARIKKPKLVKLQFTKAELLVLAEAATLRGMSVLDFCLYAAREAALEILKKAESEKSAA